MGYLHIDTILDKFVMDHYSQIPSDLLYGKNGLMVYYTYYASLHNKKDAKIYKMISDDIIDNTSNASLSILNGGLVGTGICLDFILYYLFPDNSDYVLEEIDQEIYKQSSSIESSDKINLNLIIEIALYIALRLNHGLKSRPKRSIFTNRIIDLVEFIYHRLTISYFEESIPFDLFNHLYYFIYTLSKLTKLGINSVRNAKILGEIGFVINIPRLHANKLELLLFAILINRTTNFQLDVWKDIQSDLIRTISIDKIMSKEMREKQIYFRNGKSAIYLLMLLCNKASDSIIFPLTKSDYCNLISNHFKEGLMSRKLYPTDKDQLGLNSYWGMKLLSDFL